MTAEAVMRNTKSDEELVEDILKSYETLVKGAFVLRSFREALTYAEQAHPRQERAQWAPQHFPSYITYGMPKNNMKEFNAMGHPSDFKARPFVAVVDLVDDCYKLVMGEGYNFRAILLRAHDYIAKRLTDLTCDVVDFPEEGRDLADEWIFRALMDVPCEVEDLNGELAHQITMANL